MACYYYTTATLNEYENNIKNRDITEKGLYDRHKPIT